MIRHHSRRRAVQFGLLATIAATALTACGGSEPESPRPTSSAEAPTSAAPVETPPATPPGTTLNVGDRAVIPYDDGLNKGTLALTVTAVEVGDKAYFEQNFGDDAKDATPYYIRYTLENLGGTDLGGKNGPRLAGLLADGTTTGTFITGDTPDCSNRTSPGNFDKVGAKYENCTLDAAGSGDEVVAARYNGGDYDEKPIIWRIPGK
ncbi:hypothetical protein [Saccharopolyspora sp. NPDC002376]